MKPGWEKAGKLWQGAERLGGPVIWEMRSKITGAFTESALSFIRTAKLKKKPFFINIWPDDVHGPFWPSLENWKDNLRGLYLSVLEEMDQQLSPLFDHIKKDKALKDNTLILICSDNGPDAKVSTAAHLKGYKTHLYEGGVRSPLIAWGPGLMPKSAQGTRNKTSVFSAIDLVPSLLEVTSTPYQKENYDGENLLLTLLGKSKASREKPLFFNRPPDRKSFYGFDNLPDLAIRQGDYKLLCDYDGSRPELYNVELDPSESKNISEEKPDLVKSLSQKVTEWYQTQNNNMVKP